MNYFIDFEANIANEIISVGCVNENGETFYSLIKPTKRINPFIEELTGITNTMVETAEDINTVFAKFFDWINKEEDKAKFFCYGDCDINFVLKALKHCNNLQAQLALSLIASNLKDYQLSVKKYFKVNQAIGLVKLISYYRNETVSQSHDALEDALWLKEVYEHINLEELTDCPFSAYKEENQNKSSNNQEKYICQCKKNQVKIEVRVDKHTTYGFKSCGAAADWLINNKFKVQKDDIDRNKICNRINSASLNNKLYFGWTWARKEKEDNV